MRAPLSRPIQICKPAALLILAALLLAGPTFAGTLDRIRQDKIVRIAYRPDAPPFSYVNKAGDVTGFMVDLCRAVVSKLSQQLNLPSLGVDYVAVTAANRFDAIRQGKADLLCEPTSATLSRRKLVDFSIATFVDGASLMITPDGPQSLPELAGRSIGVLAGTTTEQELHKSLAALGSPPPSCRHRLMRTAWQCWMTARYRLISPIARSCWG